MFLIALWVLFFVTDDFVENDILNKKNDLQSKASFMGKIARPAFENNKVSDFQLMLEMYDLFDDPQLLPVHKIKIYRYEDETDIGKGFVYYNGTYPIKRSSIAVTPLEAIGSQGQNNKWYDWDIMGALFSYYRKLSDARVVMAPIVSKRSKFNPQYHVIKSGENTYDIRVLAPIKVNRKTVALIEVWEDYDLKNAYFSRNSLRVAFLIGISFITLVFGLALAFSIAFPLRRLSKRLNRKLTPSDLADQMTNMSVTRLASRKDEIGLLHNNLTKLTKQIIDEILLEEDQAENILKKYTDNPELITEKMFCNPPENYFITSEDMVSKAGVWAHFGSWDFEKALAYNIVKSNTKDNALQKLQEELNYSEEESQSIYRQLNGLSEREANAWIAPYPSYSQTGRCQTQNSTIICENGIIIENNQAYVNTKEGQVKLQSFRIDNQIYSSTEGSNEISVAYDSTKSMARLMHPALLGSMFTELFFFNGENLDHFELFNHEKGVNNFNIYTYYKI